MEINKEVKSTFDISDEYFNIAVEAATKNIDFDISNSSMNHAKFLIYLLFSKAEKSIQIYSGDLDAACYDDIILKKALTDAQKKGVKIHAIVKNGDKIASIFKDIKIKVKKLKSTPKSEPFNNHFIVVDQTSYRIEAPHQDKQEVKARVNFNDKNISHVLSDLFYSLTELTDPIKTG